MRLAVCTFGLLAFLLAGCTAPTQQNPAATYVSAGGTIRVVSFDATLPAGNLRRLAAQAEREYIQLKAFFRNDVGQVTVNVRDSGVARHFPPASIRIPSHLVRNGTAITAYEIVHLLAQGWASQVFNEGLAVYLQERIGEQSGWPNYRRTVDAAARHWRQRKDIGVRTLAMAETAMRGGRKAGAERRLQPCRFVCEMADRDTPRRRSRSLHERHLSLR